MFAVTCLPTVTGAWQYEGGGAHYSNHGALPLDLTLIEGLDVVDPATRMLDQSRIGPVLCGDKRDLGDGPPVTALFIQNTNPMVVAPESGLVHQGFRRDDLFVCVHEQFHDRDRPDGRYRPAGDEFPRARRHLHRRRSPLPADRRAMLLPHAECRSNHEVICGLAARLGARHPGFQMTAFELIEETLRASGLPGPSAFEEGVWLDCWPGLRPAISWTLRPPRREVPFPRRLGLARRRVSRAASLPRPCRGH